MELGSVSLKINTQNTPGEVAIWAAPVSGTGITGGGSGYAAIWRTRKEFCTVWNSAR
jgi:hypothetical protein